MTSLLTPPLQRKTTRKDYLRAHGLAKESDRNKRLALLEIYESELYRHAGYSTWSAYIASEWSCSEGQSYRLLRAARVAIGLTSASSGADPLAASDRALCELAKIDCAEMRNQIWAEASADGDTSEEKIRDLVAYHVAELGQDDDAHQLDPNDFAREARGGQPPARSGTDWADRIERRVAAARHLHAKLGERRAAADKALDQYLAVVKGGRR